MVRPQNGALHRGGVQQNLLAEREKRWMDGWMDGWMVDRWIGDGKVDEGVVDECMYVCISGG
jgi:hypothetical protein